MWFYFFSLIDDSDIKYKVMFENDISQKSKINNIFFGIVTNLNFLKTIFVFPMGLHINFVKHEFFFLFSDRLVKNDTVKVLKNLSEILLIFRCKISKIICVSFYLVSVLWCPKNLINFIVPVKYFIASRKKGFYVKYFF